MDNQRPEGSGKRRTSALSSRPPFVHSRSCPNIPELVENDSDPIHPCDFSDEEQQGQTNQEKQNDTPGSESDTIEDDDDLKSVNDINWTGVTSSPTRHNRISSLSSKEKDRQSNSTTDELLEAALDHKEAQDRHVRFQDHVMESAALVERMLNIRDGGNSQDDRLSRRLRSNSVMDEADLEGGEKTISSPGGFMMPECTQNDTIDSAGTGSGGIGNMGLGAGGSVLSSLMKLEAQRRRKEQEQESKREKRKEKKQAKKAKKQQKKKPTSLYDFPVHSSTDPTKLSAPQRPKLIKRPASWLSTMAASGHLVPSLEKRKLMSPSVSRRSSIDSMFTTASQFEPITLEDRIRITFEIANILQKQEFLRKLVKSLMLYGCPAHRLEYIMRHVSSTLGVDAEYVYMPNVMFMSVFDQGTHTTETHFIRQAQTFEMHKLGEVYRLEKLVAHGEVSVDEALQFIDSVANEPSFYPRWLNPFIYGVASFTASLIFFGGYWYDACISAGLAMILAFYEVFSGRIQSFQPIWEVTVCIIIGFVARAVTQYGFCFTPIAFASFVVILPGYGMAIAVIELVSRQLVSGVIRMVYAIIYSFLLGYGIEMGSQIYQLIDPDIINKGNTTECTRARDITICDIQRIDQRYFLLLVPLFALVYCMFVKARPVRWPTMIIVSVCGYVVNYLLQCYAHAPAQILQTVPAFTLGLLGNLYTKFTGKMSFDAVLLGVFYLVPGGLSIKAGYGMFSGDDTMGTQGASFALAMIESSIGITIGLFVATLVVYPKGSSHTPLMNF